MKRLYLILIVVFLFAIGFYIIALERAYSSWGALKNRNHALELAIASKQQNLVRLREQLLLATATRSARNAPTLSPYEEKEALLSGFIKHGDHVIELHLPPHPQDTLVPTSVPLPASAHPAKSESSFNWRPFIVPGQLALIFIALILAYKRKRT